MLLRQRRDAVVDLAPHLIAGDRSKFGRRNLHREVELAAMPDIHHGRCRPVRASQKMRHQLNRLLRRRQSDARRLTSQQVKALQRQGKMRAALVVGHGVNFVHDHRLHIAQDRPALVGRKQDVERLRRGHQDVRRTLQHVAPLFRQRVAGAHGGADFRHQHSALCGQRENFAQRSFEVLLDVIAQGLQRRDVQHLSAVARRTVECLAYQAINADQERGKRLAGTGRRRNQRRASRQDFRPALLLWFRRRSEPPDEPLRHQRVGPSQRDRNFTQRHARHSRRFLDFRQLFARIQSQNTQIGGRSTLVAADGTYDRLIR